MGATRLSWAVAVALVAFAGLTVAGIFAEAGGERAELFASITALECLIAIAVLRPQSFTHLDGDRALLAFALSVPWSGLHLCEHLDAGAGFGARLMWLLVVQVTLLIVAIAGWAHCRRGPVVAGYSDSSRAITASSRSSEARLAKELRSAPAISRSSLTMPRAAR